MEVLKEIEVFYGDYKNKFNLKAVDGSYNKETKSIKMKVEDYVVEYEGINKMREKIDKIEELKKEIPTRGELDEIHIYGITVEEKYFVYNVKSRKSTEINVDNRKHFIGVPAEMIDEFLELENGNFKNIYVSGNDYDKPTFIEI